MDGAVRTTGKTVGPNRLRLVEAAAEATLILVLVLAPTGWRAMDGRLVAVLLGMLLVLTAGGYALHAVTFDYFRLTGHRTRGGVERTDP
jgi:uncharacterized membrane protein